jgi:hypothetical protein
MPGNHMKLEEFERCPVRCNLWAAFRLCRLVLLAVYKYPDFLEASLSVR